MNGYVNEGELNSNEIRKNSNLRNLNHLMFLFYHEFESNERMNPSLESN
jgi:hypothetical protein